MHKQFTDNSSTNSQPNAVGTVDTLTFHGDRLRLGWNAKETILTPANVSSGLFGSLWNSPQFDSVVIDGTSHTPHLYASPLYVENVLITSGPYAGSRFGTVFAAASTGYVYAVKAFDTGGASTVSAGTILWRKSLGRPTPTLDGN